MTFKIDPDKEDAARLAGWRITRAKVKSFRRNGPRSTRMFVTVKPDENKAGTFKYGWRMPNYQLAHITDADRAALGMEIVTGADVNEVIYGADPKPPRVSKIINFGDADNPDNNLVSTFCSSSKVDDLGDSGWSVSDPGGFPIE